MDVLFKFPYSPMLKATDSFIVSGYEQAIIDKALSLEYADQEGKEKRALGYDAKAERRIGKKSTDKEGVYENKILFQTPPVYRAFGNIGSN
jgi:hypothetical protein